MAIIKQYHADTDTTYVYESVSYWDEEKKQSRSRRRVIGKVDPDTGEIVPTGKRGRKKKNAVSESAAETEVEASDFREKISELTTLLKQKDLQITRLEQENKLLRNSLLQTGKLLEQCTAICADAMESR